MNPLRIFIVIAVLVSSFTTTVRAWTPNAQELDIASRMKSHSGQQRAFLAIDPILSQVARERAADMAKRRYFSHTNPDGHGANYLVRQAGYVLPDSYPSDGNTIESIAAGGSTAGTTWGDWMGSSGHKRHLLGEDTTFRTQTAYGIGYYEDAGSEYRHYWVVITAPPMPSPATIAIISPAESAAVPEGALSIAGIAGGAQPVASVQISIENVQGTSTWSSVAGTQNWSSILNNLAPGPNTLRARSLDAGGAVLAQVARNFQYIVVRPIRIQVVGQGTVPNFQGTTMRRVGNTYAITANPSPGWLFSAWSGSWGGSQPAVSVQMSEGLDATATFIPNPFVARRGMYSGLIGESAQDHNARGSLRLQLNAFGKVTGQLFFAGKGYAVLGQFRQNGRATIRLAREGATPLVLVLVLDGGGGQIAGAVIDGAATHTFAIAPARQTGAPLSAFAGRYTVAFPATRGNTNTNVPAGDGYGLLTVDESGGANLAGALADGTVISRGGWISENGSLAFYTPLYEGRGELSGTLTFANTTRTDVAGNLDWIKPPTLNAARFPQSFATTIATIGARHTAPAAGQSVLTVSATNPNVRLRLGAETFTAEATQPAHLSNANLMTINSAAIPGMAATIDPKNGMFAGTFTHPVSHAVTRFRGVISRKGNEGRGFFLGAGQSGYVTLAP